MKRKLFFFENHFKDFFLSQDSRTRRKIKFTLELISQVERIPESFLRKIKGIAGLFEIRVRAGNNIFRIFCCFDRGSIIVLLNGFQKKTMKTPQKEIERASRLMSRYYER